MDFYSDPEYETIYYSNPPPNEQLQKIMNALSFDKLESSCYKDRYFNDYPVNISTNSSFMTDNVCENYESKYKSSELEINDSDDESSDESSDDESSDDDDVSEEAQAETKEAQAEEKITINKNDIKDGFICTCFENNTKQSSKNGIFNHNLELKKLKNESFLEKHDVTILRKIERRSIWKFCNSIYDGSDEKFKEDIDYIKTKISPNVITSSYNIEILRIIFEIIEKFTKYKIKQTGETFVIKNMKIDEFNKLIKKNEFNKSIINCKKNNCWRCKNLANVNFVKISPQSNELNIQLTWPNKSDIKIGDNEKKTSYIKQEFFTFIEKHIFKLLYVNGCYPLYIKDESKYSKLEVETEKLLNKRMKLELPIELQNNNLLLYDYQLKSLRSIFAGNRARSGTIILPCGSGKTAIGIMSILTMKQHTIIVAPTTAACNQWKREIESFCNLPTHYDLMNINIASKEKEKIETDLKIPIIINENEESKLLHNLVRINDFQDKRGNQYLTVNSLPPIIFIVTHSKLTNKTVEKQKNKEEKENIELIKLKHFLSKIDWGLMIADEIHKFTGKERFNTFMIPADIRIGLTASYILTNNVKEKLESLEYFVGPILYAANIKEIEAIELPARIEKGEMNESSNMNCLCCKNPITWPLIAKIRYVTIVCNEEKERFSQYIKLMKIDKKRSLITQHTKFTKLTDRILLSKIEVFEHLIKLHDSRNDKILIFAHQISIIRYLVSLYGIDKIDGKTKEEEAERLLEEFRSNRINKLILSNKGETALDLPDANILIQIDWNGKSESEQIQRAGRIQRRKSSQYLNNHGTIFYTLIDCNHPKQKDQNEINNRINFLKINLPGVKEEDEKEDKFYKKKHKNIETRLRRFNVISNEEMNIPPQIKNKFNSSEFQIQLYQIAKDSPIEN